MPPATPPFCRLFTPGDSPATSYSSSGLLHLPWSPFSGPHHFHFVNDNSLPECSISVPISGSIEGQPWGALGTPSTSRVAQDGEGANGSRPQSFRPPVPKSKPPHSCPPEPLLVPGQRDAVLASTPTGHGKPNCTLAGKDLKQTRKFTLERS